MSHRPVRLAVPPSENARKNAENVASPVTLAKLGEHGGFPRISENFRSGADRLNERRN
jgi:hypothetical protein